MSKRNTELMKKIVEEVGGSPTRIGKLCGISMPTAHSWKTKGIPNYQVEVVRMRLRKFKKDGVFDPRTITGVQTVREEKRPQQTTARPTATRQTPSDGAEILELVELVTASDLRPDHKLKVITALTK